jgi:tetratricopeptide (TPR) repeat protein
VRTEALVIRSGFHMVADEREPAIRMAREALTRFEGLDRPDLRARAFDVIGTSRTGQGDEGGLEDQRRATEIAREGRALFELHASINNRGASLVRLGQLREFDQTVEEWRRVFEEIGGTAWNRAWLAASLTHADFHAGRWDSALERIAGFLASVTEGTTHYLESDQRPVRAMIELARDRLPEARADLERALEVASGSRDPQVLAVTLCARATLRLAEGAREEAVADFEELLAVGEGVADSLNTSADLPLFVWLAVDLDRGDDAQTVVARSRSPRWTAAARSILAGDAAGAADLFADIGHRPAEAYARLRAGGEQVQRVLDFYRSVGAIRYVREVEALDAASG